MKNFNIEKILDNERRVTRCPTKFGQRLEVIAYIAKDFTFGRVYTELEINDLIRSRILFKDYVTVRRELVCYGFLSRTRDCREYRRAEELPRVGDILAKF